ncbi:diguanylate cyclase [Neptuniibacter sp. QD57_21]|uniref:sensor domain-containing diguanylate cyclase n=1 Tax=Neptuniibacter sp. QD57_21 TaxID=3398213 RepID=UPI0039F532CE
MNLLDILNQQPQGIAELTVDEGHYLFFNRKELEFRGLSESTLKNCSIFDLFNQEQAIQLKALFKQCSQTTTDQPAYFYYQRDNQHFEMRLVKHGENILSTLSDVTSQQEMKAQIEQDQETIKCLDDAVNGANIGCWDFYPQQGKIIANKTWVTQKRYRDEEFREDDALFSEVINGLERWSSIVHPEDLEPTVELIEKHLNGETEIYDAKFRMICGDGKWRWIHDVGRVFLRDDEGNAIRMNGVHIDITEARTLEEKIEKLAVTDALTDLFNRRNFQYLSQAALERAKRQKTYFCLLILDVDHFKAYNDTYGHLKGDDVLKKISQALKDNIRQGEDYCFRVGGEEFAVVFTQESKESADIFANRIRLEIEKLEIPHKENTAAPYITVSMGLSCTQTLTDKTQISDLYQRADKHLYQAKENGRNSLVSQSY